MAAALLVLWAAPSLGAERAVETVRVSVGSTPDRLELAGGGLKAAVALSAGDRFKTLSGDRAVVLLRRGGKVELQGSGLGPVQALRFRAAGRNAVKSGTLMMRGELVVSALKGELLTVNVLPLEDYLAGVLGSEMPSSFPPEALKAQAVAARTYALHKKIAAFDEPFHLGSNVIHQVYQGLRNEDARTRKAVEETRGQVLTYQLVPVEAYFHASCGGRTESGLDALGRELAYLKPTTCPCAETSSTAWATTVTERELQNLFRSRIDTLKIFKRTSTGHVRRLDIGSGQTLDAVLLRQKVGYDRLKSLWFEVEPIRAAFRITGKGYGHGAGMCQWGARALANRGWGYERILAHYYRGTEIQLLY